MNTLALVAFCHSFTLPGLTLFCQTSVVLVVGLLLSASLSRRGPLVQSLIYRTTLVAFVFTAFISSLSAPAERPLWRISLPDASKAASGTPMAPPPLWNEQPLASLQTPPASVPPPSGTPSQASPVNLSAAPSQAPTPPKTISSLSRVCVTVVLLWALGAASLLSWLLMGQLSLVRLRLQGSAVTTGPAADILHSVCTERAGRRLTLITSPHIHSPFLAGLWRPVIFMPCSSETDFDGPALRAIFTHEIVHRERGDNWWMLLARLSCALLWIQPFIWVLTRRMEQASKEVCDGLALNAGCSPRAYASCLLSLAERRMPSRLERSLGAGMVPFRSQVGRRIQQILAAPRPLPTPSARLRGLAVIGTALIVLLGSRLISSAAPPSNAADVVSAYLNARALGQFPAAYGFLSRQTQRYVLLPDYAIPQNFTYRSGAQPAGPYAAQDALFQLFEYGQVTPGCRYELIGPAPDDPSVALVHAHLPSDITLEGLPLRIVTTRDPMDGGKPRLDMVATLKPFVPDVEVRLQARSEQKACASNLKQIGHAILEYTQDHNERFPHAAHWVDEIMPYVKDVAIFHDPTVPASQRYSYAFNRDLSGIFVAKMSSPAQTVLVFDSSTGVKNASDTGQSLPHPGRHTGGNDFLLADGHEKFWREWKQAATFSISGELPRPGNDSDNAPPVSSHRASPNLAPPMSTSASLLAGLTAVQGPGVIVTLSDSHSKLHKTPRAALPFLIHDTDINQVINELKAAGAEALAVNDERLVATSPIRCAGPTVLINNVPQAPPFVIRAIGNPAVLQMSLNLRGGVRDQLSQLDPAMIQIKTMPHIVLPAYNGPTQDRYARPVGTTAL